MYPLFPQMEYLVMDATNMNFTSNSFDNVIDKGTLDALSCGDNTEIVANLCKEMYRVAQYHVYIISHSPTRDETLQTILGKDLKITKQEIELSPLSIFTNILRHNLHGNPVSESIKNPEILGTSYKQCIRIISPNATEGKNIIEGEH